MFYICCYKYVFFLFYQLKKRNMTKKEAVEWYSSLPDDSRMKLQREFDLIYDNLGSRETKFFRWIKSFRKSKQKEYYL